MNNKVDIENIKLSVVLPFNSTEYLDEAIESIRKSHNDGIQLAIFFIDTRINKLSNYKLKLAVQDVVATLPGGKYGESILYAISRIDDGYVALMNADDLVHPERFVRQLESLQGRTDSVSVARMQKFPKDFSFNWQPRNMILPAESLLIGPYLANATWLGHIQFWRNLKLHPIPEEPWDWITAIENLNDDNLIRTNETLYFYRQHKNQTTRDTKFKSTYRDGVIPKIAKRALNQGLDFLNQEEWNLIATPWIGINHSQAEKISIVRVAKFFFRLYISDRIPQKQNLLFAFFCTYHAAIRIGFLIVVRLRNLIKNNPDLTEFQEK